MPTTNAINPAVLKEMDGPLTELAQKSGGDLRHLLYGFFSFLQRRTDFYCIPHENDIKEGNHRLGFKEGDAEKMLLAAFRQFPLRKMPPQTRSASDPPGKSSTSTSDGKKEKQNTKQAPVSKISNKDIGKDTNKTKFLGEAAKKTSEIRKAVQEDPMECTRFTDEGKQVPIGNGGATPKYRWTQTSDEVSILVGSLPEGTRGKDLNVSIKSTSIAVTLKLKIDNDPEAKTLCEGKLSNRIQVEESTWSLEGGVILLVLQKSTKKWWSNVLEGDSEIDTTLVDSRRRIDEYDDSTQGMIRRIIFDQDQERLGKPTSDEILHESRASVQQPLIPPMPPGVEYIDKSTFEKNTRLSEA